jgi:hypothetical protein
LWQKPIKPRDAASGYPDVDLHAGYNALDAYHLMSQKQQEAALAFCKVHKEYKNGTVVESLAVAAEPKNTGWPDDPAIIAAFPNKEYVAPCARKNATSNDLSEGGEV